MTINFFDRFGHNWWNLQDGEFKLLHAINPLRMSFIIQSAKEHFNLKSNSLRGLKVLDIGCGGGLVSTPVAILGADMTAIDSSAVAIDSARAKASTECLKINYICSTLEDFATKTRFDIVLCMDVVEHVDNLSDLVAKIVSLVNSGGLIIISTINKTLKALVQAIYLAEYVLRLLPKGTHEYEKLVDPSDLEQAFNKFNFGIKNICGIKYSLIHRIWEMSDDTDINYMVAISALTP